MNNSTTGPTRQELVSILAGRIHNHMLLDGEAANHVAEQSFLPRIVEFVTQWLESVGLEDAAADWSEEMS